jgi:hypothetical protein
MRMYDQFVEVKSEVSRDLKELAVVYQSHNVQDMDVSKDPGYFTHELMNYSYTLLDPGLVTDDYFPPYYLQEFKERISNRPQNPGLAWEEDREYWEQFLHDGKFDYTYSERMAYVLEGVYKLLVRDPNTRQAWLSIWNDRDHFATGRRRVPCSLGYHFMVRNEKLHLHYVMRSCDFAKHFEKDVILAIMLQVYMAQRLGREVGHFTHTIFSLHAFAKDLEGVF